MKATSLLAIFLIPLENVIAEDPYEGVDPQTTAIHLGTCSAKPSNGVPLFTFSTKLCWNAGSKLKVQFFDGTAEERAFVMATASEWSKHASVTFEEVEADGDIRITFLKPGFSSVIGKGAKNVAKTKETMILGFIPGQTVTNKRAVVLHEFGHALGFAHEHQSPTAPEKIVWDRDAVIKFYGRTQGWSPQQIENNVLNAATAATAPNGDASDFDPKSIMLYPIPKELTINGFHSVWNNELSDGDKKHARKQYPEFK